jgi:hypothetical protein
MTVASLRVGSEFMLRQSLENSVHDVGDTIIARVVASHGHGVLLDTLQDTMRIVEFVVRGRGVQSVTVSGDDSTGPSTKLEQVAGGREWRGRMVVPRDALRFAFRINNERMPATSLPLPATPVSSDSI